MRRCRNSLRTRQVRAVSEIEIFMSQHWSTMVTVYIIGAAVTFVLTFVIFWMLERQSEKEEREKELFPEYYEEQERKIFRRKSRRSDGNRVAGYKLV